MVYLSHNDNHSYVCHLHQALSNVLVTVMCMSVNDIYMVISDPIIQSIYSYERYTRSIRQYVSIGVTLLIWAIKQVSSASNIVRDTYLQIRIGSSVQWS